MGRRVLALVVKEFLAIFKDKKSRVVVVVPPLLQLLVFGYAATYDLKHVPYAIFNEDQGSASRELLSEFEGSPTFRKVSVIDHEEQMAPLIERRQALMVLRIGQRFTSDLLLGGTAQVQVIVDGRNSNTAMLVLNYARTIIGRFNDRWSGGAATEGRPTVYLATRAWFNPNLESRWFIVPGIAGLLTLVVTVLVTALSVAREREQGTFDQLLVTPLRPVEILLGKAIPGLLIGVAEATVIILAAVFWFQIPLLGAIGTLYTGVVLFLLSCIGIGLMISSLSVTQQQGMLGAFLFLVPAVILSGFTTPIANMPQTVQYITYLNPMRYFMIILRGVFLEAAPLRMLIAQLWPMAAIGMTALGAAGWLFRRRMY